MKSHKILVIDDESYILSAIQRHLENNGFSVDVAITGDEGVAKITANPFQYGVIVLDYKLPDKNGEIIAKEILAINPEIKIAMHSGYGTIENVRSTFKAGVVDFIEKGKDPSVLLNAVECIYRKFEEGRSVSPNCASTSNGKLLSHFDIVGSSQVMVEIAKKIPKFRATDSSILILGENGTGKELIAQAIWKNSLRKDKPFIKQNFAAISEGVLESELFGHVRGSFTNAIKDRKGLFEQADKGTLFLRVLQEGVLTPVGGEHSKKVDVRIIAATNRNLVAMVKAGSFREDLYYRLNVLSVELPPLRKRIEDIEPLVLFFCNKMFIKTKEKKKFLMRTVRLLEKYPWPGNIRELQNIVESTWVLCSDEKIEPHHLESKFFDKREKDILDQESLTWEKVEYWVDSKKREYVISMLPPNSRTKSEAAAKMGVSPSTLHSIMKSLGLYGDCEESSTVVGFK